MNTTRTVKLVKVLIIFSPLIVALLVDQFIGKVPGNDLSHSVSFIPSVLIGIPAIAIIGKLNERRISEKSNHQSLVLLGYAIPAILANALGLYLAISS